MYTTGVACLEILNDIIVSFDKLLFNKEFARVEKIKVIYIELNYDSILPLLIYDFWKVTTVLPNKSFF